jgi:acetolactate synthase-1/2/3 large subunit
MVCITGQVPTHLIGNDAFQECDTVGITRPAPSTTGWSSRRQPDLPRILHEAFYVATTGRPGPVVVDIPKDVQFATGTYTGTGQHRHEELQAQARRATRAIEAGVELIANAKKPVFYTGGGVINSGPEASKLLRELVR